MAVMATAAELLGNNDVVASNNEDEPLMMTTTTQQQQQHHGGATTSRTSRLLLFCRWKTILLTALIGAVVVRQMISLNLPAKVIHQYSALSSSSSATTAIRLGNTIVNHDGTVDETANATKLEQDKPSSYYSTNTSSSTKITTTPINNTRNNNYVVLATTLNTFARQEDYDYLVPLVARNWLNFGFIPIVIVVATDNETILHVKSLWDIMMPKEAHVVPLLVPLERAITVAQISRLYAAHYLLLIPDDAYLRVTDGDMMIHDATQFLPPNNNNNNNNGTHHIISLYGGHFLLKTKHSSLDGKTCHEYPMHSVGMSFYLWRKLFPMTTEHHHASSSNISSSSSTMKNNVTAHILNIIEQRFKFKERLGGGGTPKSTNIRFTDDWSMDQILLGCTIGDASASGNNYFIELVAPEKGRLHVGKSLESMSDPNHMGDIHLAKFKVARHRGWMDELVNVSNLLEGYESDYKEYTDAWTRLRGK